MFRSSAAFTDDAYESVLKPIMHCQKIRNHSVTGLQFTELVLSFLVFFLNIIHFQERWKNWLRPDLL